MSDGTAKTEIKKMEGRAKQYIANAIHIFGAAPNVKDVDGIIKKSIAEEKVKHFKNWCESFSPAELRACPGAIAKVLKDSVNEEDKAEDEPPKKPDPKPPKKPDPKPAQKPNTEK